MTAPKEFKLLKIIQKIELFAHLTAEEAQVVLSLSEKRPTNQAILCSAQEKYRTSS